MLEDLRSRTISLPTFKRRESSRSVPPAKIRCRRHTDSSASSINSNRSSYSSGTALLRRKLRDLFFHLSSMKVNSFLSSAFRAPEYHFIR